MKIAIVGGGISGLVVARILSEHHEITLFEADSRIGGHTHTVDVALEDGQYAVDTGFIVYNEATYPNFVRLLDTLGVETQPTEMSFGVTCERTGLEWGSRGWRGILAQPGNLVRPSFLAMLRDIVRFNRATRSLLESGSSNLSLREFVKLGGFGRSLVEHYLVPMGAAIWSADPDRFLDFPALTFVRFFDNHGLLTTSPDLPWRVIRGGSARYVEKLVAPFASRVRPNSPVRAVRRVSDGVELLVPEGRQRFDQVVLALHSDQALELHEDPSPEERKLLEAIAYQENDVVLHTDVSLLPRRPAAWASWNYRVPEQKQEGVLVTYDMSRLQGIQAAQRFLVTLNAPEGRIDPNRILGRYRYAHPVFDAAAIAAQGQHGQQSGRDRIHYCGAYWGNGFHEDGVRSALAVCKAFGADL